MAPCHRIGTVRTFLRHPHGYFPERDIMVQLYVTLTTLLVVTRDQLETRARRDDRGSVSLEQVVIALGLFLVAGALVAGLTTIVRTQMAKIQ